MTNVRVINQTHLIRAANLLILALDKYAPIHLDAERLRQALAPILERAARGLIEEPLEWEQIPGVNMFSETRLREYRELESAYASFKIQVTGEGESPILKQIHERMQRRNLIDDED